MSLNSSGFLAHNEITICAGKINKSKEKSLIQTVSFRCIQSIFDPCVMSICNGRNSFNILQCNFLILMCIYNSQDVHPGRFTF